MSSKPVSGTKEWACHNVNCYNGCRHDCLYCYAKSMRPNIFHKKLTCADINSIPLIKSWPDYLFLSSYSEPFLPEIMDTTFKVVDIAFANDTFVSFSTKRPANDDIIKLYYKR